jgi:DNA polymerase-3 subunit beta
MSILKGLPDGDVVISSTVGDEGHVSVNISVINYPNINCSIKGKLNDNFPTKDEPSDSEFFSVPNGIIERMIPKVLFSISDDTTRASMCGVHLVQEDNYFTMVSTDGRILSITKEMVSGILDFQGVTIPPKVLKIIKSVSGGKSMMSIAMNETRGSIYFRLGNMKFSSNLITHPYPSYKRIIPDSRICQISVDRNNFIQAVKRTPTLDIHANRIYVTINDKSIEVSSPRGAYSSNQESMPITVISNYIKDTTLALNRKYLIGLSSLCDGDKIILSYDDEYESIIIEDESKSHKHLLMPMKAD